MQSTFTTTELLTGLVIAIGLAEEREAERIAAAKVEHERFERKRAASIVRLQRESDAWYAAALPHARGVEDRLRDMGLKFRTYDDGVGIVRIDVRGFSGRLSVHRDGAVFAGYARDSITPPSDELRRLAELVKAQ